MQFDDQNIDKENENLQDSLNSISWEDLLNAPEDVDLKSLANETEKKKKKETSYSDFSANSLKDEVKDVLEDDKLQNNENKEFDVSSAANNYVNNIEPEDAGIIRPIDGEEINLDPASMGFDDELLLEGDGDFELASKDLSEVMDDELIGILNEGEEEKPDDKPIYSANEPYDINAPYNESTPYDFESDDSAGVKEDKQNEEVQTEENIEDDFVSMKKPAKKKQPVLVFALVLLIGLAGILYCVFSYMLPNKAGSGDEIALNSDSAYNTLTDEDVQKQTEELINKVDAQNQEKADKENKKENKITVQIQTGGRANPFMPSSVFDDNGFAVQGAQLSTPPDIENTPEAIAARKLLTISVSGIMYDPSKPSAILRFDSKDYFVQKGDRIDTYVVKQITKDYVAIGNGTNTYKAYVGEDFAIDSKIPESSQMKTINGNRQYISSSDIEISTR